ncbi:MAG: SDR family oxidoreductase [Phycisphaerae bacterium]|nr:SDR family oxidoreductase [Phycisphaerae bacterium]
MPNQRRTALVTGGAKRVGRAIALHLLSHEFDVAVTYLTSEAEAKQLRDRGVTTIQADHTDPATAVQRVADVLFNRFDGLDVLVNSASIYTPGRLAETTVAQIQRLEAIHLHTPLLLCQRFGKHLRRARGCVINMVDLLAERPWPEYLAYCASKAALANLTLGLARELAPEVTVNGIAPGVVEWPANYPQAEIDKYLSRVPLARSGSPEEVAKLVHFLCTEGRYITGQIIRLDGGRSIT